jgi:hypothetical protein
MQEDVDFDSRSISGPYCPVCSAKHTEIHNQAYINAEKIEKITKWAKENLQDHCTCSIDYRLTTLNLIDPSCLYHEENVQELLDILAS